MWNWIKWFIGEKQAKFQCNFQKRTLLSRVNSTDKKIKKGSFVCISKAGTDPYPHINAIVSHDKSLLFAFDDLFILFCIV